MDKRVRVIEKTTEEVTSKSVGIVQADQWLKDYELSRFPFFIQKGFVVATWVDYYGNNMWNQMEAKNTLAVFQHEKDARSFYNSCLDDIADISNNFISAGTTLLEKVVSSSNTNIISGTSKVCPNCLTGEIDLDNGFETCINCELNNHS